MNPSFSPLILVPTAKILLLGTFGYSLAQVMRGKQEMSIAFERLVVAFLGLTFFIPVASGLDSLAAQLTDLVSSIGRADLRILILDAFKQAAREPGDNGKATTLNLPAILEQAWRTGVWGIMSSFVEGTYLIVSFVLECARDVLWKLVLFLFPLACGAFPLLPRLLTNLSVYALELSLWFPMLALVERLTGSVAQERFSEAGGWGLYLVGIQSVGILLILLIPSVTHRFLSGALSGDFNSQQGIFVLINRIGSIRPSFKKGGRP